MSRDRQQQLSASHNQQQQISSRDRPQQLTVLHNQQQQFVPRDRTQQLTESRDVSAKSIDGDIGAVENKLADVDKADIKQEVEADECQYNHSYSGNISIYENIFNLCPKSIDHCDTMP